MTALSLFDLGEPVVAQVAPVMEPVASTSPDMDDELAAPAIAGEILEGLVPGTGVGLCAGCRAKFILAACDRGFEYLVERDPKGVFVLDGTARRDRLRVRHHDGSETRPTSGAVPPRKLRPKEQRYSSHTGRCPALLASGAQR